jgi:hypothetical protein
VCRICSPLQLLCKFLYAADKKFMTCLLQVAGSLKGKRVRINGISTLSCRLSFAKLPVDWPWRVVRVLKV